MKALRFLTFIGLLLVVASCGDKSDDNKKEDKYDRKAMLTHWADNIIVKGYTSYTTALQKMQEQSKAFISEPTTSTLSALRADWKKAYVAWQDVAMFEIGKAEEINLQGLTNTYPANVSQINSSIDSDDVNFGLPSMRSAQGFPAIEYLIYGDQVSDEALIASFTDNKKNYLEKVVDLLLANSNTVLDDWKSRYRDVFVNESGSSATASVNKVTNDFIFYYEKFLRAGKVGIPAGVFSSEPIAHTAEAPYSGISKTLLYSSLDAVQNFFNGKAGDGSNQGDGYATYLKYLESDLPGKINAQFDAARDKAENLDESFKKQVIADNVKMLELYDALQKNVVTIKVDMLQKLNVKVDYVDADGD